MPRLLSVAIFALLLGTCSFADDTVYQKPSKEILDVLHAPSTPLLDVNPSKTHAVLIRMETYPPISEVAAPMLRLAGIRISPATNSLHSSRDVESLELVRLSDQVKIPVALPGVVSPRLSPPRWSVDGNHFAFTNTSAANGVELWIGTTTTGKTRRIDGVRLNPVLGNPIVWIADNKTLLVRTVPANRGAAPAKSATPKGPKIQESEGRAAGIWTNPDALKDTHDEDLFDYYGTSQLAYVDIATGKVINYGRPALYIAVSVSPDNAHVLATSIHRPYTYLHYYTAFPKEVEVWDRAGNLERKIASLPLEDRVPVDGVPVGPRNFLWRANEGASLLWTEALDGGNPKEKVPNRDRVMMWKAPFSGEPKEAFKVEHRLQGIQFVDQSALAMVNDYNRDKRWVRTMAVNLDANEPPKVVFSRNMRDRYNDPGQMVRKVLPTGASVVASSGGNILLDGAGAGPKGDRPFLDRFNLQEQKAERLFQSSEDYYEQVVEVLDADGKRFITRRESPTEPPNYMLYDAGKVSALTSYRDPVPQLRGITKQLVTYKRPDGVPLSFTLYLPPGYQPGKRLPTVVWAYPLEYDDAATAGQVSGSAKKFTTIAGTSHLYFLLQGYAILDNASMPVVGTLEKMNDTYIEQVVSSAKAAIDKAAEMGVTDPERVGVGGHSYGGFMTANLLAHSDLFRAGIARSGAYNRTLTPFGFQSERRTLWEAPETYLKMSPFMSAHKIKEPILLIHGEADNNQGTFPIQSERMYQAIRGNGGHVRYVVLPAESHGYGARESVEHTLWEMTTWFDKHVKNAPARMTGSSPSGN